MLDPSCRRQERFFVGTQQTYYFSTVNVDDPDGAQHHPMGAIPTSGGDSNLTQKFYATDASGYYIDATNPSAMVLYDSHGNKYVTSNGGGTTTATDSNGKLEQGVAWTMISSTRSSTEFLLS